MLRVISIIFSILTVIGYFACKEDSITNFTFIIASIYGVGYIICERIDTNAK